MEKHQKHTKLTKPFVGNFSRNEWAIIGTPCGNIQKLTKDLTDKMSRTSKYKIAYIDADHKAGDTQPGCQHQSRRDVDDPGDSADPYSGIQSRAIWNRW